MEAPSVVERLASLNPETEIWWDSSPLVYDKWKQKMIADSAPGYRDELEAQLTRFLDLDAINSSLACGVTTNPPLSLQAIEGRPDIWEPWIDALIEAEPDADVEIVFWKTYLEVVRRGAEIFRPMWEASDHRRGYLSGQVDPRVVFNEELMFRQALDIAACGPNVMIKCPGSAEGIRVIRRLTARGLATNCTLSFIVPQFVDVMDAVELGLAEARRNNLDLGRFRSVITQMSARFEDRRAFGESAASVGVGLTEEDRRWSSIAIFRKAYKIVEQREYPGKMLFCSIRRGPVEDGVEHMWHIEKVAGGAMVYTLPPSCLTTMWELGDNLNFEAVVGEPVPEPVLNKLLRVPYFAEAYSEEMDPERYRSLAPMIFTMNQFAKATERTVDVIGSRIAAIRGHA